MSVSLIAYPKDVEKFIAFAARTTYKGHKAGSPSDIDPKWAKKMLKTVLSCGHGSVIEHGVFTFDIRNISRALTHQFVRHRIASYTQESQHYINYGKLMVVMPKKLTPAGKRVFMYACKHAFEKYRQLIDFGLPHHEARAVLPNAVASRLVASLNARSLYNFFGLRCCERNTWEIKELAWRMLALCRTAAPTLFSIAGPRCVQLGFCPEGANTCPVYKRVPRKPFGKKLVGER